MPNLEQDQRFLASGILVLSDYLLSKELLYPLDGDLPRLTIGNLLLAQIRLHATGHDQHSTQIEEVRNKWQQAWEQKAAREIHMRFELWRDFLGEYKSSHEGHADRYPVEVRHRIILQILKGDVAKAPELALLPDMDLQLRGSLHPDKFIWEQEVASGFDKTAYWFLYGKLKTT
jgi:hypothetical protein